jgi:hypothetical protein
MLIIIIMGSNNGSSIRTETNATSSGQCYFQENKVLKLSAHKETD